MDITPRVEVGGGLVLVGREIQALVAGVSLGGHAALVFSTDLTPERSAAVGALVGAPVQLVLPAPPVDPTLAPPPAAGAGGSGNGSSPDGADGPPNAPAAPAIDDRVPHLVFRGVVRQVEVVARPQGGSRLVVEALGASYALGAHRTQQRFPAQTVLDVARALGVRVDATASQPAPGSPAPEPLPLVQPGERAWAGRAERERRPYALGGDDAAALAYYFARGPRSGLAGGRLWVRAVKLYADGALGSRGAALLEPYSDDPKNTGLLVSAPAHIRDVAVRALRAGFQVNTHAIGDRGNRLVLDAYEAALKEVPTADHRFRVEHAQVLHHDDVPRFAQLGVIPSMQASHQTSDMYWAGTRLGETRLLGAYAWWSLLDAGSIVPNGSDFPVERVDPLISFHAAVTRQDAAGWPAGGWHPEQRMTRDEALRAMTLWPAMAAFQEKELGSLTAGKYADFVVLDRDVMRAAPEEILGTRVLATYVGGKLVYQAPAAR